MAIGDYMVCGASYYCSLVSVQCDRGYGIFGWCFVRLLGETTTTTIMSLDLFPWCAIRY